MNIIYRTLLFPLLPFYLAGCLVFALIANLFVFLVEDKSSSSKPDDK